jgi:uncharacterized protein (TIGR00251 family)
LASVSDPATTFYTHDPQRQRITLTVHVQPGAATSAIVGPHGDALKIRIAAPAIENKANAALLAFLAKTFGVRLANILIRRGSIGRRKVIAISGVGDELAAHIRSVLDSVLR